MNSSFSNIQLRIAALWAFSEAFLGGLLHAFQIPFAGLVLSAFAVICMAAIALQNYERGQILKATILVIILKALLSPHTPVTAYFAVLLQGLLGELFFMFHLSFRISCLLLGIAALLQSAFQKLIILTLIFGIDFWKAVDEFLNSISKQMGLIAISYSFYIVAIFLSLHLIAGILTGFFAGRLPQFLSDAKQEFKTIKFSIPALETISSPMKKNKNKFANPLFWILFLLLAFALYQAYSEASILIFIKSKALKLFIRSTLFILVWYFFVAPIIMLIFQKWLAKQQSKFSFEINGILKLLPEMKYITEQCWLRTKDYRGVKRITQFIKFTFFSLHETSIENPIV